MSLAWARLGVTLSLAPLVALAAASNATAAPVDDAEVFVQRGIAFRKEFNKDQEALTEFQRAYQLARTPRIQAQIGAAEQALGRWVDAELHIVEALSAATDVWIAKNRPTLEQALVTIRMHLGRLDIIASPPGAEIRIDGREIGRAPLSEPVRVAAGSVVVELRAPGHFPVTRTVLVAAEQLTRETLMLQPSTGTGSAAPGVAGPASAAGQNGTPELSATPVSPGSDLGSPPRAPPNAVPQTSPASGDDGRDSRKEDRSWRRPLAWTFAAGAVAFAGGGVAALIIGNDKAKDYNTLVDSTGCRGTDAATCSDLHSDGDTARTLSIVGFSVAGALAVTSTILFVTEARAPGRVSTALGMCGIDWGTRGVSCGGTF